ncbi:MAG: hypothetical protein AABX05_00395 [Nanoarchaeota archaeon]
MSHKKRGIRKTAKAHKKAHSKVNFHHRDFWVVLGFVLLVSVFSILVSIGPSSVTGGTVQSVSYVREGQTIDLGVRDIQGVEWIYVTAKETVKGGQIVVSEDKLMPFEGSYISKFVVSSPEASKYGSMRFNLKLKEQSVYDLGISLADLRLYYNGVEYPLQLLTQGNGYVRYVVTVPGMGKFVLGKKNKQKIVPSVAESAEQEVVAEIVEPTAVPPVDPERSSLAGKAVELPSEQPTSQKGIFIRLWDFLKGLFN